MAKRIYAITAEQIKETGEISFIFMFNSKAPYEEFREIAKSYGLIKLRDKDENEVNFFKLSRLEPNAVGPDGVKKWELFVGSGGRQVFFGSCEERANEQGLQELLLGVQDCVLLMEEKLFSRFEEVCKKVGIALGYFHYQGDLSTS